VCGPCSGDPDERGNAEADGEPHAEADEEVVALDEDEEGERADDPPQEAGFRPRGHASVAPEFGVVSRRPTATASVERLYRIRAPRGHSNKSRPVSAVTHRDGRRPGVGTDDPSFRDG